MNLNCIISFVSYASSIGKYKYDMQNFFYLPREELTRAHKSTYGWTNTVLSLLFECQVLSN